MSDATKESVLVGSRLWWRPGIPSDPRSKGWESHAEVLALDPARIEPETSDAKVQYLSPTTPPGTVTHLHTLYT